MGPLTQQIKTATITLITDIKIATIKLLDPWVVMPFHYLLLSLSFFLFLIYILCGILDICRKEPKWPHDFFPLQLKCFKINLPHTRIPATRFCFTLNRPKDVLSGTWATLPQRWVITGGKSYTTHKYEGKSFLRKKLQRENQCSWINLGHLVLTGQAEYQHSNCWRLNCKRWHSMIIMEFILWFSVWQEILVA